MGEKIGVPSGRDERADEHSKLVLLRAAARDCAEWIEGILGSDDFEDGCDWPEVDGTKWCSDFCQKHGCAKSRSFHCRDALSKTVP